MAYLMIWRRNKQVHGCKVFKNIGKCAFPILFWKPCTVYRTISIVS